MKNETWLHGSRLELIAQFAAFIHGYKPYDEDYDRALEKATRLIDAALAEKHGRRRGWC